MLDLKMLRNSLLLVCSLGLVDCSTPPETLAPPSPPIIEGTPHSLHFVVSAAELGFHPDEDYILHVGGERYPLVAHTEESKQTFASAFAGDPATHPTHYVHNVGLPDGKPIFLHITQRSDRHGTLKAAQGDVPYGLVLTAFHIPEPPAPYSAYSTTEVTRSALSSDIPLQTFHNTRDVALSILFHHPELMNNDPTHATNIMDNHISKAVGLLDLERAIGAKGPHGWYTMEQITDPSTGDPVLSQEDQDGDGNPDNKPLYQYVINDDVLAAAKEALSGSINSTKNDPTLEAQAYHPTVGTGHIDDSLQTLSTNSYDFALSSQSFHHGFRTRIESDGKNVTLYFRNDFVRHVSVFIEFYDENDQPLPLQESEWTHTRTLGVDFTPTFLESASRKYLNLSTAVPLIMGIPIAGDYTESSVTFPWIVRARYAKVLAGGLGWPGGDHYMEVEVIGAALTGVFDIGIPAFMLAATVGGGDLAAFLDTVADTPSVVSEVVDFMFGVVWEHSVSTPGNIAKKIGRFVASLILTNKWIRKKVVEYIFEKGIEENIPFVGWALHVADVLAGVAQLTEATVESLTSPPVIENILTPTHDMKVVIDHDPDHAIFPTTATHYTVNVKFSASDTRTTTIPLPATTVSDPLTVTFSDVPAGGHVDVDVFFHSDTGWLAGVGQKHAVLNVNDTGMDSLTIELPIEEQLVPLSSTSIYTHKEKMTYATSTSAHIWEAAAAPTQTKSDMSDALEALALSGVVNLSMGPKGGNVAYAWKSYSSSVSSCSSPVVKDHLFTLQNISTTQSPETGFMFSDCGYKEQPYILLDPKNEGAQGHNYVVVPGNDGNWYVRKLTYTATKSFDLSTTQSYGAFPLRVDSMVRHPNNVLLAINNQNSRMYSLKLPNAEADDSLVTLAVPVAGEAQSLDGLTNNPSLLRHPIGVKLSSEGGSVMVLDDIHELTEGTAQEQTKGRLKVFTWSGTPVNYFTDSSGAPSSYLDIVEADIGKDVTYLDFDIEGTGFIYILSYAVPQGSANYTLTAADYRLDIYKKTGDFLARTTGFAAARLALDLFRNVYTANYEVFPGPAGRTEPSISLWIPPTPKP